MKLPSKIFGINTKEAYEVFLNREKNPDLGVDEEILEEKPEETELERDSEGKPKLSLAPLEQKVVNTETQEEYDTLMQVYECGGWKWNGGSLPTQFSRWGMSKMKTCVRTGTDFTYTDKQFYQDNSLEVISTQEFYDVQNINSEMIKEINEYFEKTNPKRKSKG